MALSLNDEADMQRVAGVSLILTSHLLSWDMTRQRFTPTLESAFEDHWPLLDPNFGRLICWIMFSAGAEFLGKGVCLRNSIEVRSFPNGITDFGTMKTLVDRHFLKLFRARNATDAEEKVVKDGYKLLQTSIRNRDAHAYHKGVRRNDFPLLGKKLPRSLQHLARLVRLRATPPSPPTPRIPDQPRNARAPANPNAPGPDQSQSAELCRRGRDCSGPDRWPK